MYELELEKGSYIIVFKYDTNIYLATTYHQKDVSDDENSDAITQTMTIDGENITVAATDTIDLNKDVSNINLGLVVRSTFDLSIKKYINKITVKGSNKTSEYAQKENATLAKVEIGAKDLSNSLVVIEYKIKVTNNGEISGYAKNIVDYMPQTLNFNSSMNSDWYMSGNSLYNKSLANTKIEPGETKELTLILTKQMTETNTGLVNNKAGILETGNDSGAENKSNESGSADVIISVSTGALINYILITFGALTMLIGIAFIINKKIFERSIK